MRICTKCNIEKPESEFHKDKSKLNGLCSQCKDCRYEIRKQFKLNNPEKMKQYSKVHYERQKDYHKEYHQKNAEKRREYYKAYYQNKAEKIKENAKRYWESNKEKIIEYHKIYRKKQKILHE